MSELISREEACILFKHGVKVITRNKTKEVEYWYNFCPLIRGEDHIYKKKFETVLLQNIESAKPIIPQEGEVFYMTIVSWRKCQLKNGKYEDIDELKRNREIAFFKTNEECDEISKSLSSALLFKRLP